MIQTYQGHTPQLAAGVYIADSAVVIGKATIGAHSSVWPTAVIRADVNTITIGENTSVQDGAILHCTHDGPYTPGGMPLTIGNNITIGHAVSLHACTLEDNCLVGVGSIILDKAVVEPYTIIGAGSLVPPGKRLAGGHLYMGSPVKQIRPLSQEEKDNLDYSAAHYVRLKDKYLAG